MTAAPNRRLAAKAVTKAVLGLAILVGVASLGHATTLAQIPHHPFAVGAFEGAVGRQTGLGAWILGRESAFYRLLTGAVRAVRAGPGGMVELAGLSFAYGVFHAAGPGHGKAVITSYMVSNEVALRRGLVIACLAALVQGMVAVTLVGTAVFVFNATAPRMTAAASALELCAYLGIIALGLALVWRKGRALIARLRPVPAPSLLMASAGSGMAFGAALGATSRFAADDGTAEHVHGPGCGHVHMPDPRTLSGARFDRKAAALTILTAGARPCSGAILVLVFAISQGVFLAGVAATLAMSLGTALTTGALATVTVFFKDFAVKLAGIGTGRGAVAGLIVEVVAAACVLAFGTVLLGAALSGFSGAS